MSFPLTAAIWTVRMPATLKPHLAANAKYVLLALANRSRDERAWPSIPTLSTDTGLGKTCVRGALHALQEIGWIRPKSKPRQHYATIWEINLPKQPGADGHPQTSGVRSPEVIPRPQTSEIRTPERPQTSGVRTSEGIPRPPESGGPESGPPEINRQTSGIRTLISKEPVTPNYQDPLSRRTVLGNTSLEHRFAESKKNYKEDKALKRALAARAPAADGNVAITLTLAHQTYQVLGPHATRPALSEHLKTACARYHIHYDSYQIERALEAAHVQRQIAATGGPELLVATNQGGSTIHSGQLRPDALVRAEMACLDQGRRHRRMRRRGYP